MKFRFKILKESKEDIQAFVDKFGKETYDLFVKLKGSLSKNHINPDFTWHTKYTDPDKLKQDLLDIQNKVVKDVQGNTKLNRKKIAENDKYTIYDVLDWETAMNMGDGTVWCISGRYDTNEVKPSQAKYYFDDYKKNGVKSYLFLMPKNGNNEEKYCLVIYNGGEVELWNNEDYYTRGGNEVRERLNKLDIPNFEYSGFKYDWYGITYIVGSDGTLVKYLHKHDKDIVIDDKNILYVGPAAFEDSKAKTIKLPNSIELISTGAFYNCRNLESVYLPNSVRFLQTDCFYNCISLEEITLPNSISYIGAYVFYNCTSLTHIEIPPLVTRIHRSTFAECSNLREVYLNKVTDIAPGAFEDCPLKTVKTELTKEEFFDVMESFFNKTQFAMFGNYKDITIYCKDGNIKLSDYYYEDKNGWPVLKIDEFR